MIFEFPFLDLSPRRQIGPQLTTQRLGLGLGLLETVPRWAMIGVNGDNRVVQRKCLAPRLLFCRQQLITRLGISSVACLGSRSENGGLKMYVSSWDGESDDGRR